MRICVVGAGAIGGLLGARLAIAGEEVAFLARGATLQILRSTGLRLVEPDGTELMTKSFRVSGEIEELGAQDLVILALKAHQIQLVAERLPALYHDDTMVVTMQNGVPWWFFQRFGGKFDGHRIAVLEADGVLSATIPVERILGSVAYPAVDRDGPGVVRLIEGDRFPIGELDGTRSERSARVADVLSNAGFKSRVVTDIRQHIWVKAWGNLAMNPISALTGATLAEICRFPPTRAVAAAMMEEAQSVGERLGLRVRLSVEQRIDGAERIGHHKTSMLQDVEAGHELEIAPLIGSFVELGRLTEVPMPVTETALALVSLLNARTGHGSPEG